MLKFDRCRPAHPKNCFIIKRGLAHIKGEKQKYDQDSQG